ncbi:MULTISPECIES: F0F1 ATP synthase subunit A [Clostridium]|uniref:ATP synthase subunit a n=1 Tax=Clostridium cibarium TaxID=2762247 RepID=A0ABR8PWW2_9CLOT|nr:MULTISPECIES: F0F1 ATP synthase subunit A [Clostridium]MBD7912648.1 F0F1 ATP synthase subunit A [Clostridium cibarium]
MEAVEPIFSFDIGGFTAIIGKQVIWQWIIMLILAVVSFLLTRNLKREPGKVQIALESLYRAVENLVKGNMGENYVGYIPYVGTLIVFLVALNLTGLVGVKPPTACLGVTAGLAISTFVVINANALKRNGLLGFLKGLASPSIFMLPLNLMERVVVPFSLALRLFGNMVAAVIITDLAYEALEGVAFIAGIGLPVILHAYFDVFDGLIQMLVFTMLTVINIKVTAEHH